MRRAVLRLLAWGALYIAIHLAIYAALLRRTTRFSSERGIFLYHALSVLAVLIIGFGALFVSPDGHVLAGAMAVAGLHGIYSLSFLELWSLAEGSYSLSILEHVETATSLGQDVDMAALERLGGSKKERRLDGLERLGFARCTGDQIALTHRGRWVADVLAGVAWPARTGRTG